MKNNNNNDELKVFQKVVVALVAVAIMSIAVLLALYIYNFMVIGKADQETFAQFGDYIHS